MRWSESEWPRTRKEFQAEGMGRAQQLLRTWIVWGIDWSGWVSGLPGPGASCWNESGRGLEDLLAPFPYLPESRPWLAALSLPTPQALSYRSWLFLPESRPVGWGPRNLHDLASPWRPGYAPRLCNHQFGATLH